MPPETPGEEAQDSGETGTDRVHFETLIADISARLIAAAPEQVEPTIQAALDNVRAFFQADRTLFLKASADETFARVLHGAYAEGLPAIPRDLNLVERFPWASRKFLVERVPLIIRRMGDLPPEAAVDRASWGEFSPLRSHFGVPILEGGVVRHVVSVHWVAREYEVRESFVPRLRVFGEMIVSALRRSQAFHDLQASEERLKRQEQQLRQALEDVQRLREKLESENVYLREEARHRLGPDQIVGRGPAIRRTLALAEQVAPTDSTVLLLGETGSGKERFASYIHACSRRRDRPMIRVNCSAIPASLIESELFGREKGAYTGALSKQIGRFELAHGSTLFLDEIGELSVEIQVKLLRVIETRTIERLGNPRPVPIDVRIVAATNRDLTAAVRDGRFREDLFYRLNVFPLTIPPLRDRREDIPLFVQTFVDELSATMGKRINDVDAGSLEALQAYEWPGNVRELRNVVERAMIMTTGPLLRIVVPRAAGASPDADPDPRARARVQVLQVLQDTGWRIRGPEGAAARLGLKPSTLESRVKKLGLARPGTVSRTP